MSQYKETKALLLSALTLFLFFPGIAQTSEQKDVPNYILRNNDFVDRRISTEEVNFARTYYESFSELNETVKNYKKSDEWTPIGPFGFEELAGTGRVNNLQFHPTDTNTWFICVAQGGVWKTTNAGQSWISISGDLPILRTSSLAIDPTNTDIMYVALGDYAYLGHNLQANESKRTSHYGLGIYKTTDGGQHWLPTGLSFNLHDFEGSLIARVFINKANTDQLIAVGQTGAYVSTDGGDNWQKTSSELFWDLEQDPDQNNVLYASTGYVHTYGIGTAGILKSTDFGLTWSKLNTGIPDVGLVQRIEIAISPTDNNYIYAIACDTLGGFYGFYKSTNAGNSFEQTLDNTYEYNILNSHFSQAPGGQGRYDLAICVDRYDKNHVLIGGINVWHTLNGGQSFEPVSFWRLNYLQLSLHADIHQLLQHPVNNSYFACHDGGLSRCYKLEKENVDSLIRDKVKTKWVNYRENLNISSFYRLSINELNGDEKIAGAQDNSTVYTNGISFRNMSGGDGMESEFIDKEKYRFTSSQNGRLYVYEVVGDTAIFRGNITAPNKEFGEWTTPMVEGKSKLYVLYGNLYSFVGKYGGGMHSQFPNQKGRSYPQIGCALEVERSTANRIYLAKRTYVSEGIPNEIWTTADGGDTWKDISEELPRQLYPSSIEMDQGDPDRVWISFSGFDSAQKVFYSPDGGDSWENITYNLPNVPVNSILLQDDGSGLVYIGTDLGVFYLKADSTEWVYYSNSLPKVIVSELEIDKKNKTLVAATFGRGIWEVGLVDYRDTMVGIENHSTFASNFELFPNPATDQIKLTLGEYSGENLRIKVVDITGRVVISSEVSPDGTSPYYTLDTKNLIAGEYFVVISTAGRGQRAVLRFIRL